MLEGSMISSDKGYYHSFWGKSKWVDEHSSCISNTVFRERESKNSFCFGTQMPTSKENAFDSLCSVFPFLASNRVKEKFNEAVSGDGHEWRRINRLHSSSLLPFLMFSQISAEKPLSVQTPDGRKDFSEVHFEVKNWLEPNDRYPSNIDVVLENRDSILFIESKFTEYLCRQRKPIYLSQNRYGEILQKVFDCKWEGGIVFESADGRLSLSDSKRESHYLEGLKQIVAHYLGIKYAVCHKEYNCDGHRPLNGRKAYFCELAFSFDQPEPSTPFARFAKEALNDYGRLYSELVRHLPRVQRLVVFPDIVTYQFLFADFQLDQNVKDFYQLG